MSVESEGRKAEPITPSPGNGPVYPPSILPRSMLSDAQKSNDPNGAPAAPPVIATKRSDGQNHVQTSVIPSQGIDAFAPTFFTPQAEKPQPATPNGPAYPAPPPAIAPFAREPIFVSDHIYGSDIFGRAEKLHRLSELLAHRDVCGPLSVALLGGPGEGKSHALQTMMAGVAQLSKAANAAVGPFLPYIVTLSVDAADSADEPAVAIAGALHEALEQSYAQTAQHVSEEAMHSAADPYRSARALNETLDEARRRADSARAALNEAETKRARLSETVLYEAGGSQIDAYARAHRSPIETALRGFGFLSADPLNDYKGLVQSLSETGDAKRRAVASLRSLWAYRGQKKLIFYGLAFFVLSWGFGLLAQDTTWIKPLDGGDDSLRGVAQWMRAHVYLLDYGRRLADYAGIACFIALLWRAWRFSYPLWRGAQLLDLDVAAKKGDLERQIAHLHQRIVQLDQEADTLAQRASEAERRAGGLPRPANYAAPDFVTQGQPPAIQARAYLAALSAVMSEQGDAAKNKPAGIIPSRVIVAVDSLDRLAPDKALATYRAIEKALAKPGFTLVTAFNPRHFDSLPFAKSTLKQLAHIPFHIGGVKTPLWSDFVDELAGRTATRLAEAPKSGANLDLPLSDPERKLLTALAPLAGPDPRGVKKLVNLYRIARHDAPDDLAALALMLALAIGGVEEERRALADALAAADHGETLKIANGGSRLAASLDAANMAQGGPVTGASAARAHAIAQNWSL